MSTPVCEFREEYGRSDARDSQWMNGGKGAIAWLIDEEKSRNHSAVESRDGLVFHLCSVDEHDRDSNIAPEQNIDSPSSHFDSTGFLVLRPERQQRRLGFLL